jgi:hypothetical protein
VGIALAAGVPGATTDRMVRVAGTLSNWAQLTQQVAATPFGRTYTFSVWLQAESGSVSCQIGMSDVNFVTGKTAVTATTTPQRFSFTASGWNVAATLIAGGIDLVANGSVLVWGAQLVEGSAALQYMPTTSAPAAPNLLSRSDGFEFATWLKDGGISVVANVALGLGAFTDVSSDVLRFDVSQKLHTLFSPLAVSDATVELDNPDGRYSPLNAGSPYYPNLKSQRQLNVTASYLGNALVCDGVANQGIIADAPVFRVGSLDSFSVEAWIKTTDGNLANVLSNRTGTTTWWTAGVRSGQLVIELCNAYPAHYNLFQAGSLFNDGAAHHVAWVRDARSYQLLTYLNGSLTAQTSESGTSGYSFDNGAVPIYIAGSGGWGNIVGALDEVMFYKRALPASEVAAHAVGSFGGVDGLGAHWSFDEAGGRLAFDAVGGNDALLAGYAPRTLGLCATQSYALFRGWIAEYQHSPLTGKRTIIVTAQDAVNRLGNTFITTSLFQNMNPASLFTEVMSASAVGSFTAEVIAGDVVPFGYFRDVNARNAVQDIINFGYYNLTVDGGGTLTLRNRYFNLTNTSVRTLTAFSDFTVVQNESQLVNSVKIQATPRRISPTVNTVTWLQQKLSIPASGSVGFWLTYVDPVAVTVPTPATSMTTPVASTDFLCNVQSDGLGADLTNQQSVTCTFYGEAAVCSMFNGTGNVAIVNKFQVRGFSAQQQPGISAFFENSLSELTYGKHQLAFADDLLADKVFMDSYVQELINTRSVERPVLTARTKNTWPSLLTAQPGQLLSVVESVSGANGQWLVMGLRHSVALAQGLEHVLELNLENYTPKNFLILDDPVRGKLDSTNVLTF